MAITDGETSAQYIVNATNEYLSEASDEDLSEASTVATGITCTWASRICTITKFENIADSGTSELRFSNGSTYVVSISATNAAGAGPTDDPSVVVGQPNEPSSVTTAAAQASFNVCWANPSSIPAGRQIVAYKVTASDAGVSRTKVLSKDEADEATGNQCSGSNVGATITQFDDGTSPQRGVTYTISVQASVSTAFAERPYGRLSALSTVVPLGIPDAPTLSTVTVDGTTATLTWAAPSNTGGQSITAYTVSSTPSGFGCTTTGALTCVVTGLVRGSTYTFSVVATNASGDSAASTALSATSPTTTTTTTTTTVPSNQTASGGGSAGGTTGGGVTQSGASTTTIVVANSSPLLPKSSWRARSYRGAIGSQVLVSSTAGATVTLNISSRSITVWFKKGSLGGQASIAINGKTLKLVDLYSKKPATAVVRLTAPGKAKTNKVTVRVLGKKSRFSKGTEVALDAVAPGSTCGKGCSKNPSG
ncbi:MAG: fibronectin type III domain-containing protein [Actinobacteria bacterium]|nr:fibronectin type III domain-containing protein [Actinomycetota bacterium]